MKLKKSILILLLIFLVWVGFKVHGYIKEHTFNLDFSISENVSLGEPLTIDILITKNRKEFSPEEVTLTLYHQYDTDIYYKSTIPSYKDGEYQLILTPEKSGTYKWSISFKESNKIFEGEFKI